MCKIIEVRYKNVQVCQESDRDRENTVSVYPSLYTCNTATGAIKRR